MTKKGCVKCDYTGFSYGDIPCECSIENGPTNNNNQKSPGSITVSYDLETETGEIRSGESE